MSHKKAKLIRAEHPWKEVFAERINAWNKEAEFSEDAAIARLRERFGWGPEWKIKIRKEEAS